LCTYKVNQGIEPKRKRRGQGSHEAEVSFLSNIGFKNKDVEFANQLRYFRNGIIYYGKEFGEEYAQKVVKFLKKVCRMILNQKPQQTL